MGDLLRRQRSGTNWQTVQLLYYAHLLGQKKNMHYLHTDAAQVRYYEVKASSIKRPIYAIRGNDVQTPFVV